MCNTTVNFQPGVNKIIDNESHKIAIVFLPFNIIKNKLRNGDFITVTVNCL